MQPLGEHVPYSLPAPSGRLRYSVALGNVLTFVVATILPSNEPYKGPDAWGRCPLRLNKSAGIRLPGKQLSTVVTDTWLMYSLYCSGGIMAGTLDNSRPLGVRVDLSLTDTQISSLEIIEQFDLGPIRSRIIESAVMPSSWVDEAIFEFRRYLGLHTVVSSPLPMFSRHVDQVWHQTLLFSRRYTDLCNQAFGTFLHHEPRMDIGPDQGASWVEFKTAYEDLYGPISRIWLIGHSSLS
jgi:hypothetical protein